MEAGEFSGEIYPFQKVVFLKVDVDENKETAQEYKINAMPTFILLKECQKVNANYY